MGVDVRLLTEELMALQHVPYEFAELAKTQAVTLHLMDHERRPFEEAMRRGAKGLRKEANRLMLEGRPEQAQGAAAQAGLLEGVIELLTAGEEDV